MKVLTTGIQWQYVVSISWVWCTLFKDRDMVDQSLRQMELTRKQGSGRWWAKVVCHN